MEGEYTRGVKRKAEGCKNAPGGLENKEEQKSLEAFNGEVAGPWGISKEEIERGGGGVVRCLLQN